MQLVPYGKRDGTEWATCPKSWAGLGKLGPLLHGVSSMVPTLRAGSSTCILLPHQASPAFDIQFCHCLMGTSWWDPALAGDAVVAAQPQASSLPARGKLEGERSPVQQ